MITVNLRYTGTLAEYNKSGICQQISAVSAGKGAVGSRVPQIYGRSRCQTG